MVKSFGVEEKSTIYTTFKTIKVLVTDLSILCFYIMFVMKLSNFIFTITKTNPLTSLLFVSPVWLHSDFSHLQQRANLPRGSLDVHPAADWYMPHSLSADSCSEKLERLLQDAGKL